MRKIDFIIVNLIFFFLIITCKKQENETKLNLKIKLQTDQYSYNVLPDEVVSISSNNESVEVSINFNNTYYNYEQLVFFIEKVSPTSNKTASFSKNLLETFQKVPLENTNIKFSSLSNKIKLEKGEAYKISIQFLNSTKKRKDETIEFQIWVQ